MWSFVSKNLVTSLFKGSVLFFTAVGVMVAARLFEIESLQDPAWVETHLRQGAKGVLAFMGLTAVSSALGLPRQALAFLGGYAFGALYGLIWTSIGLIGGCSCGFFYSRMLGRDILRKRLGNRIRVIDSFLCKSPFLMAVAIRCFPVGNNAITNMAAGVTSIPPLPFIAGSSIGYIPQTLVFALLGSGIQIGAELRIFISALLFAATSLLGLHLFRRFRSEQEPAATTDSE